jgi:hypothetical protein
MGKAKFKVGDKVKCIGENRGSFTDINPQYGGAGWIKGRIYTVKKIVSSTCVERNWVYFFKEVDNGVFESHLELLEKVKKEIKLYGIVKFCQENYR